ncbi:hypothetical protein [Legionella gresilensis]|uniref:hypothetical protein n=1 Tax=Legionella gresilensis TaxID=91823 RepID=UPI00104102C2|nr:hypothetical protein [Legionella gresilensis]
MNLAFPALLIFLLIMPGLFFINSYYKFDYQDINFVPLGQKTALALLVALVLHALSILLLEKIILLHIDSTKFIKLIANQDSNTININSNELIYTIIYIIILCTVGFFLGVLTRKIITYYKLDKKIKWLRLNNKWVYFFKAYDFFEEEPDLIEIFAMIETGEGCYIYIKDYLKITH